MRVSKLSSVVLLCVLGCFDEKAWDSGYDQDDYAAPSDEGDADTDADADTDWGSESEDDFLRLPPATTDAYVFVASPERDTVTRVSVPSLDVLTVAVGDNPALVATSADYAKAVCFSTGSDDLAVIDAESLDVVEVPLRSNLNALEMSPDGAWAVVYHDADIADEEYDDQGGAQSFNEISLVNLDSFEHFPMVVGSNPRQVVFTDEADQAIVVSDQYLAIIDLLATAPGPELVQLAEDLLEPPRAEEIAIAPDGSYAFVRQFAADEITVIDLASHEVGRVEVGFNPTDLDIMPDGSQAVVVSRGAGELSLLDVADPFAEPEVIELPEGYLLGSLALVPDGSLGVLYTTAALEDRYATWDVGSGEVDVHTLVKPIDTLSISPTGETLLIFHTRDNVDGADPEGDFYDEYALTMADLGDLRTNPLRLPAEPLEYANSLDGAYGYFAMDGEQSLVQLDYSSLLYLQVELKSDPVHVGVLPDTDYAWVSQQHELGRISFFDAQTESLETITGFELNGEIEH